MDTKNIVICDDDATLTYLPTTPVAVLISNTPVPRLYGWYEQNLEKRLRELVYTIDQFDNLYVPLYADGFETGDSGNWSATAP